MKVLLFTHIADIDGMGSAILAKTLFEQVDVVYCNTFDLAKNINENLKRIKDYDEVFVTDLSPDDEIINIIENNSKLKEKIEVFDHHPIKFSGDIKEYPYFNIKIKDENGKFCCGTSLFFDYLKEQDPFVFYDDIAKFVELTRQYDTWDWKTANNGKENQEAEDLNILFFKYGKDVYVQNFTEKFQYYCWADYRNGEKFSFLTEDEREYIKQYRQERDKQRKKYLLDMHIEYIDGNMVGVIDDMTDEYKNDIPDVLRDQNSALDYVAEYISKRGTISLRNIQPDFDVSKVAKKLGGGGHEFAASMKANQANFDYFKMTVDEEKKEK